MHALLAAGPVERGQKRKSDEVDDPRAFQEVRPNPVYGSGPAIGQYPRGASYGVDPTMYAASPVPSGGAASYSTHDTGQQKDFNVNATSLDNPSLWMNDIPRGFE